MVADVQHVAARRVHGAFARLRIVGEADPFEAVKRAFKLIAMATTSTSALEARSLGFLRPVADRISMNRDRLIAYAKARVLDLAPDYVAPAPRTITALGREALGNLMYAGWAMREGGQITEHEVRIALNPPLAWSRGYSIKNPSVERTSMI